LRLVHLVGEPAVLAQRMASRAGHYMPASLLQSQLDTLEPQGLTRPRSPLTSMPRFNRSSNDCEHNCDDPPIHQGGPRNGADGRARFREEMMELGEGTPQARLSALMPSGGLQLRISPVGFESSFHCTQTPQWLFVLSGQMEIGLHDGSVRTFQPGQQLLFGRHLACRRQLRRNGARAPQPSGRRRTAGHRLRPRMNDGRTPTKNVSARTLDLLGEAIVAAAIHRAAPCRRSRRCATTSASAAR
jgi:hypothetical protein